MKKCHVCGSKNSDGAIYCYSCKTLFVSDTQI